jgi:hypothetical protein
MLRPKHTALLAVVVAVFCVIWSGERTTVLQAADKPPKDKLALGEDDVKQLLVLMDADKNGRISRDEYMRFMTAEFDRLDKDKSGELDVKELTQSLLRGSRSGHR